MTVVANNTRKTALPTLNGSVSSIGGGAGATTSDTPAAFFYVSDGQIYRKVTATSAGGAGFAYGPTTSVDMTAAATKVFMAKFAVTDFGGLNTTEGVSLRIGSASNAYYNIALTGSDVVGTALDNYPAKGGYIIMPVDPNVAAYRRSTQGNPSLSAVAYYGLTARFATASAKSENLGLDEVDVGQGLEIHTSGTMSDFYDFDEGTTTNRYGYCTKLAEDTYNVFGTLFFGQNGGTATATTITDTARETYQFGDGLFAAGWSGMDFDLSVATTITLKNKTFAGLGTETTEDTRPVITSNGTTGSLTIADGIINNWASMGLVSGITIDNNLVIGCEAITQNAASITNNKFSDQPITANEALLIADNIANITGNEFTYNSGGHAVDYSGTTISADTTISWNNTQVGATWIGSTGDPVTTGTSGNETLRVNVANGFTLTINVSDGATIPSVYNEGTGSVVVNANKITLTVTVLDDDTGSAIGTSSRVYLVRSSDKSVLISKACNASGVASEQIDFDANTTVEGWARDFDLSGDDYVPAPIGGQYTADGFSITVRLKKV